MRLGSQSMLIGALVVGIFLGLVFAGGVAWGRSSAPKTVVTIQSSEGAGRQGPRGLPGVGRAGESGESSDSTGGQPRGGTPLTGTVARMDGDSIELTTLAGSVLVKLSNDTAVRKISDASRADITAGQNVLVVGTRNSDGSVSAASIQLGGAEGRSARR